jgi:Predicted glycosyltransferases
MKYEKEVTVILTVWKRNHLEEQIKALLNQSKPPFEIWVQQTQNHVNVDEVIERYRDKVRYFYYEENKGVFGRFESVSSVYTEYVYIIDDDIIPGVDFLGLALSKSIELNAIISPNGRIINSETNLVYDYVGDGNWFEHSFCKDDTLVDFGNNAWFFKTEWIDEFLKYTPLYRNNGEDIHLSTSIKILKGIDTYVPEQLTPYGSGSIKRHYSSDEHALHKRQNFQKERIDVIKRFRIEGWMLQKEFAHAKISVTRPALSVVMFCDLVNDNTLNSIKSITNQSFKDFEFIIICYDKSRKLAEVLNKLNDSRIRLIDPKEVIEKYVGLNIGCGIASGKYICFMDNDFTAVFDRLKVQYEYMEQHLDVVASGSSCRLSYNNTVLENQLTSDESILSLIYKNKFIEGSLIVRRSILEKLKYFRYLEGLDMFYSLMYRLALEGNLINIPDCLIEIHSEQEQPTDVYCQKQLILHFLQTRPDIGESFINKMLENIGKRGFI